MFDVLLCMLFGLGAFDVCVHVQVSTRIMVCIAWHNFNNKQNQQQTQQHNALNGDVTNRQHTQATVRF
jgi:hypothetical protein